MLVRSLQRRGWFVAAAGLQVVVSESARAMRRAVPWYTVFSIGLAGIAFLFVAQFFTFAFESRAVASIVVAAIIAMAPVFMAWIGQIYLIQYLTDGEASLDFAVLGVKARIVPLTLIAFAIVLVGGIVSLTLVAADTENVAVAVPVVVVGVAIGLLGYATLWGIAPALAIHDVPSSGIVALMLRSIRRGGLAMVGAFVVGQLLAAGYGLLLFYAGDTLGVPGFFIGVLFVAGGLTIHVFLFVFSAVLWKHRRFEILELDESAVLDSQTVEETSPEVAAPSGEVIARTEIFEPCENCGNVFNAAAARCPQCLHERTS